MRRASGTILLLYVILAVTMLAREQFNLRDDDSDGGPRMVAGAESPTPFSWSNDVGIFHTMAMTAPPKTALSPLIKKDDARNPSAQDLRPLIVGWAEERPLEAGDQQWEAYLKMQAKMQNQNSAVDLKHAVKEVLKEVTVKVESQKPSVWETIVVGLWQGAPVAFTHSTGRI